MRLAILSDTHMPRGNRAIPAQGLELCAVADAILHAGDLNTLDVLYDLQQIGPPVYAVHGNVCGPEVRNVLPPVRMETFAGATVAMLHIPGPAQNRAERLQHTFPNAGAVIFGHTHMPEHAHLGNFQIFNPGSPTERRRAPTHTMGLATITDGEIAFELVHLA